MATIESVNRAVIKSEDAARELELHLDTYAECRVLFAELVRARSANAHTRCRSARLHVHEAASVPVHVEPLSTNQVCVGSKSEWRPSGMVDADVWSCAPASVYIWKDLALAFTPSSTVDFVGEWNDCHIQTAAYRATP